MKQKLFLLLVLLPMTLLAQRERNYIYILDCTRSMTGFGGNPNIWEPTKEYLKNEMEKHSMGTTLHIIPFQDKVLTHYSFEAPNFNWTKIETNLNNFVTIPARTNICAAWDAIDGCIDSYRDNYVVLLTDGKDNINGMDAVAKKLQTWCGKYSNTYAFYVQLTDSAIDPNLAEVVNICPTIICIPPSSKGVPVFGRFDNNQIIYSNTLNLDKVHKVGFSAAGRYKAKAVCNDPHFDTKIIEDKIENGIVSIQLIAKEPLEVLKANLPDTYEFTFDVQSNEVTILNPTVKVQMTNKSERTLELVSEEIDMGEASWYDSFLFWEASKPDTLSVDLKALFNEEAFKDGSSVELFVSDTDGGKDFQLFYNHQPVKKDKILLNSKDNITSVLSVVFDSNAKEGKRYFSIHTASVYELDKINGKPAGEYQLSLRSKYDVSCNPLKTILFWLVVLIVVGLLLWLLLLKRIFFPTIRVSTIQISDPYFSKFNVRGKRRVVFTNQNMKQSFINKIFTGEILYKKNAIWTSPLAFEAGASGRTIRVINSRNYVFTPYSSTLNAPGNYVAENTVNRTRITLTIN